MANRPPRSYPNVSTLSAGVEVGCSEIEGRGLFAAHDLPSGAPVLTFGGELVDDDALARRAPHSSLAINEAWNLVQPASDLARYLNHACDSNCWMADEVTVVTRDDVTAGRELTLDYALVSVSPDWRMPCSCRSPQCRGYVSGNDWRMPALQERYRGHFSPFINERIASLENPPGT